MEPYAKPKVLHNSFKWQTMNDEKKVWDGGGTLPCVVPEVPGFVSSDHHVCFISLAMNFVVSISLPGKSLFNKHPLVRELSLIHCTWPLKSKVMGTYGLKQYIHCANASTEHRMPGIDMQRCCS